MLRPSNLFRHERSRQVWRAQAQWLKTWADNIVHRAIAQLRSCRPIPEPQVREICHKARELLIEEGNVVTVTAPVTVRTAI